MLKAFHSEIINNHVTIKKTEAESREITEVHNISPEEIQDNFIWVKNDDGLSKIELAKEILGFAAEILKVVLTNF